LLIWNSIYIFPGTSGTNSDEALKKKAESDGTNSGEEKRKRIFLIAFIQ